MKFQPEVIHDIRHPFVSSAYLKKELGLRGEEDVLVIDAVHIARDGGWDDEARRIYEDFLSEIDLIADTLHRRGHLFDRVDIRFH